MSGEHLLLTSLTKYFNQHPLHREQFKEIVKGNHPISLRVIDWFVTHYAKHQNVLYWCHAKNDEMHIDFKQDQANDLRKFHMYLEYRAQLKSYTKYYFDPFRRHERISFVLQDKPFDAVETTVGQLNFFRWALQNHIVEYIKANVNDIEESMYEFQTKKKQYDQVTRFPKKAKHEDLTKKREIKIVPDTHNTYHAINAHCQIRFD